MAQWVEAVIRARFLVASLGEAASPPWWRSQATSLTGRRFIERLFPRTALAASLETASRAASIAHDAHIGRIGAYHLFRLPIADEAAIRDLLRQPAASDLLQGLAALNGTEEQMKALGNLAAEERASNAQGPVHCGTVGALRHAGTLRRICAAYLGGFRAGRPVYPYLEDGRA